MSDAEPPRRPIAWVTWVLIAANVAMFAVEIASGIDPLQPKVRDMLDLGADQGAKTLGDHQWWRVVTSMFLHFGVIHIAMNMLCLWQARAVELMYGRAAFAAIYVVSGLVGAVGSLAHDPVVVSAGASGAVFGVFGAFGAFLLRRRDRLDPTAWRQSAQRLATFIVLNLVIGLQSTGIDVTAHVVGLIAGFACGFVLVGKPRLAPLAFAAGVAITIAGLLVLPHPVDTQAIAEQFDAREHECVTTFNAAQRDLAAGTIDAAERDRIVEQQVLPRWHELVVQLDALADSEVPAKLRAMFVAMRAYAHARETAWQELLRVDREHLGDEHYREAEAKSERELHGLEAEITKLKR